MPDSYPVLLDRALAQSIHDADIGLYKATPGAVYTNAETATLPGIVMGPGLPTGFDNCIVITQLDPISDGRANIIWRHQIITRVKGTKAQATNLAWAVREHIDHKQNVPPGFHISWSWLFSQLTFTADSNGRHSTAQTVYSRGRRPL